METIKYDDDFASVETKLLQRLLNKKGANPKLKEDGVFGVKTRSAVVAFQAHEGIPKNGIVGPETWSRLGITIDITHPVKLVAASTNKTCWSAAATMLTNNPFIGGMSVGAGLAKLSKAGGLQDNAGSSVNINNIILFAKNLGCRVYHPQTWTVQGLVDLLRKGPAISGSWPKNPRDPLVKHMMVVSALWSDSAPDGSGTMIRIHDPSPVNIGSIYGRFYHRGTIEGFYYFSEFFIQPVR